MSVDFEKMLKNEALNIQIKPIEFIKLSRKHYDVDIGRNSIDFIFHFYTKKEMGKFPDNFEDLMGDAMIEVFKIPERLSSYYTEELNSWAVKVSGFAKNPLAQDLTIRTLDTLDRLLGI